jgi:hypothetical protein
MKIERLATEALVAAMLLGVLSCVNNEARRGDRLDVSGFPEEMQDAYRVFEFRCSRCHTLARPLNARIDDPEHWVRYVRRMRRQSGSGIDAENGEVILKFLLYYHREKFGGGSGEESTTEPVEPPVAPAAAPQVSAPQAITESEPAPEVEPAPPTQPEGPKELAP